MTKITQMPKGENGVEGEIHTLENYVRKDLRNRFDEADCLDCCSIIDETRLLGLTDLAEEFISEMKADDVSAPFWKAHERFLEMGEYDEPDETDDEMFLKAWGENGEDDFSHFARSLDIFDRSNFMKLI